MADVLPPPGDQDEAGPGEPRLPIERVLPGFAIHALPEDLSPIFAFVLVKSIDADREENWSFRTSSRPNKRELLGALVEQVDLLRDSLREDWEL